jgi:two-component system nitrate/nitrite response regulator NarL
MTSTIRIIIADDHPLVLEGVRACLEGYEHIEVLGTATTGRAALELARETRPDIAMLDINMPEMNGLDATELFREELPDTRLLILSMHDDREYISSALSAGARGYILKDVPAEEMIAAIEAIHRGGTYFSAGLGNVFARLREDPAEETVLTTREQTILLCLADGKANKMIARELDISVRTVETHRKNLKRKLGISSTAGLTRYVIENGLGQGD